MKDGLQLIRKNTPKLPAYQFKVDYEQLPPSVLALLRERGWNQYTSVDTHSILLHSSFEVQSIKRYNWIVFHDLSAEFISGVTISNHYEIV